MADSFGNLVVFLVEPPAAQAKFIVGQLQAMGIEMVRSFASGGDALQAMPRRAPTSSSARSTCRT